MNVFGKDGFIVVTRVAILVLIGSGICAVGADERLADTLPRHPLGSGFRAVGADERGFFITDSGSGIMMVNDELRIDPELIEASKRAKDSRPAEDDPDGNWGLVTDGVQLSLRFEKDTYSLGEPINGRIIMRNVGTRTLLYDNTGWIGHDFQFVVIDGQKRLVPGTTPLDIITFGSGIIHFYGRTQKRFEFRLDKLFELKAPGTYLVYVKRLVPMPTIGFKGGSNNDPELPIPAFPYSAPATTEVTSGNVRITILKPEADDTLAARPARSASGRPPTIGRILSSTPGTSNPETPTRTSTTSANPPRSTGDTGRAAHPSGPAAQETSGSLATADTSSAARRWLASLLIFFILLGTAWWLCRGRRAGPSSRNK